MPEFPRAVYQFGAGARFDEMLNVIPLLTEDGFDGIQLAPVHPPSTDIYERGGETKWGSVYAPRDVRRIAPYLFDGVTVGQYLNGRESHHSKWEGWEALAQFVSNCRKNDIRWVTADLVLGHVSRDPETVSWYRNKFGGEVFDRDPTQLGGIAVPVGLQSTGDHGAWFDVAPFNLSNGEAKRLRSYHLQVIRNFLDAGFAMFRFDAAHNLLEGGYLGALTSEIRRLAPQWESRAPVFYAEVLGQPHRTLMGAIRNGGVDAVNDSLHWWDGKEQWYSDLHNKVVDAGARFVSFPTNHDTRTLVGQELYMKTVLAALLNSAYTYLHGAHEGRKPAVQLQFHASNPGMDAYPSDSNAEIRKLLRTVNMLKHGNPVFHRELHLNQIYQGGLTMISKTEPQSGQRALIAIHPSGAADGSWNEFTIPHEMQGAAVLYANNGHIGHIPAFDSHTFKLAGNGVAVFYTPLGSGMSAPTMIH